MRRLAIQVWPTSRSMIPFYLWIKETCSDKSRWVNLSSKRSSQYSCARSALMKQKMQQSNKRSNRPQCLSNLGQKSLKILNFWTTYKSRTFPSTWACKETCVGNCCIGWVNMEFPWTLSSRDCLVRKPLYWSWRISMAINLVDSVLKSGYLANSSTGPGRTLSSLSRIAMTVRCGSHLEITACTSSAIELALGLVVAYMEEDLPCTSATTYCEEVPWRQSASIMKCSARTRILNASIWRSGVSSENSSAAPTVW